MSRRCEITELLVGECAHCLKRTLLNSSDAFVSAGQSLGPWFSARFPGNCDGCGAWFWEGDSIRADGYGGYLASCCGGAG
jgi:hypothetical protein